MVFQFSKYLAEMLLKSKLIKKEEIESYVYALEIVIEKLITYLLIFSFALYFNKLIPTFLFMICFFSLRKYTGGFHMKTYLSCLLGTTITYVLFAKFGYSFFQDNIGVLYIGLAISSICIYAIGAVNHPNMDWDMAELGESKKNARMLVLIETICIYFGVVLQMNINCIMFSSFAIILCSILLVLSKITKQEVLM